MDIFQLKRAGHSIRFIARKLKLHRKTVNKYLESNSLPEYQRKEKKPSILEPYQQAIRDFLEEDNYQATWILDRLRRMGYTGSYDTLKLFVRTVKEHNNRIAYTRFETEPGHQAQIDWGDFKITDDRGKTSMVYAFVMVLGYSRAMYVEFVERCTLETFMDFHIRAFKVFRGVPTSREKSDEVMKLLADGLMKEAVAEKVGIGVASVSRIVKMAKKSTESFRS